MILGSRGGRSRWCRPAPVHQPGAAEQREVLAGVGQGDAEDRGEVAGGALAVAQRVQDHEALGVREDLQMSAWAR